MICDKVESTIVANEMYRENSMNTTNLKNMMHNQSCMTVFEKNLDAKEIQNMREMLRTSVARYAKPVNEGVKLELLRIAHMEKMQAIAEKKSKKSKKR